MKSKRFLSLVFSFLLIFVWITGSIAPVYAAESTNPYTISFMNPDTDYRWRGYVHSPYYVDGEEVVLFKLVDEVNKHEIPAFCVDAVTGIDRSFYQRINLEDSSYFDVKSAQKIRAIVNHSNIVKNVSVIQEEANKWLAANGGTAIVDLNATEVLSAVQYAIWRASNENNITDDIPEYSYEVIEYYSSMHSSAGGDSNPYVDPITGNTYSYNQPETEHSKQNIISLVAYYLALPGEKAVNVALSNAAIQKVYADFTEQEDGTYNVTVTFTVDSDLTMDNAALTYTVSSGDVSSTEALTSTGEKSVTLTNVSPETSITVEINGTQQVNDVFFFEAEGGRTESQTLVGIDGCSLPVHAEVTVVPEERVLNIYKTDKYTGNPLGSIKFDVYYVGSFTDLESGKLNVGSVPTAEEVSNYAVSDNYITTLVTDTNGFASYNLTENQKEDGIYLIIENSNPAVISPAAPFFAAVPMTSSDGSGYIYNINIYPKNETETGPSITKDVTKLDNDFDHIDAGKEHLWIITSTIPSGIAGASKYIVSDTLDSRLTYVTGSPVVKLVDSTGAETELTLGTHYTLSESVHDGIYSFSVALTAAGIQQAGGYSNLRIYFHAMIDSDGSVAEKIPNQATVDYTNALGVDYSSKSEKVEVVTGGIVIKKVDSEGKIISSGATFQIYRTATEAEVSDESIEKVYFTDTSTPYVAVEFYSNLGLDGEKVGEITTDENGLAVIAGLAYGDYLLVETKAPAGYNKPQNPIAITITENSHLEVNAYPVVNTSGAVLPETGGIGTTIFTVTGSILVLGAAVLLITRKRMTAE